MKSYPCRVYCDKGVVKVLSIQTNKYVQFSINNCPLESIKKMQFEGKFNNGKSWVMNLTQSEMNIVKEMK